MISYKVKFDLISLRLFSIEFEQNIPLFPKSTITREFTAKFHAAVKSSSNDLNLIKQTFAEQGSSVHQFGDLPEVTEDAVRAALRNEAKRHKYWKASAVTKMTINRIDNTACLHVSLHYSHAMCLIMY